MNAAGTLALSVLDTPSGGATSLIQSRLSSGSTTPAVTTLASTNISQFAQPGGGLQSNADTAFGFVESGTLTIGQLANGSASPSNLTTSGMSTTQASFSVSDGFGLMAFQPSTPAAVDSQSHRAANVNFVEVFLCAFGPD
jgi:hypothetical protein